MAPVLALLFCCATASAQQDEQLEKVLRRVAEEASQFYRQAPNAFAEETLEQRVLAGPPRFRPRIGASAVKAPERKVKRRSVVSDFGYSAWKDSPEILHEFRKVISVDGRKKIDAEKARATLTAGIRSKEDAIRKQMLRDFEKAGLVGGTTDMTTLLLLFLKPNQQSYTFRRAGSSRLGADAVLILQYEQKGGEAEMTIFEGKEALHQKLAGELWVREPDGLPVRVTAMNERTLNDQPIRDLIAVDYTMTPHGALMPVSASYRQAINGEWRIENVYRYSPFRRFGSETEIRFDVAPAPPKP